MSPSRVDLLVRSDQMQVYHMLDRSFPSSLHVQLTFELNEYFDFRLHYAILTSTKAA